MLQRARLLREGVLEQTEHGLGAASLKRIVFWKVSPSKALLIRLRRGRP
jgi:hypothetical protein